jgi:hypothetical protein
MKNFNHKKSSPGGERFQQALLRAEKEMKPYMSIYEADDSQIALLLVSGIAQFVALKVEDEKSLELIIAQAEKMCGIPKAALRAHAEASMALVEGYISDQKPKSARRFI